MENCLCDAFLIADAEILWSSEDKSVASVDTLGWPVPMPMWTPSSRARRALSAINRLSAAAANQSHPAMEPPAIST